MIGFLTWVHMREEPFAAEVIWKLRLSSICPMKEQMASASRSSVSASPGSTARSG